MVSVKNFAVTKAIFSHKNGNMTTLSHYSLGIIKIYKKLINMHFY